MLNSNLAFNVKSSSNLFNMIQFRRQVFSVLEQNHLDVVNTTINSTTKRDNVLFGPLYHCASAGLESRLTHWSNPQRIATLNF